MARLTDGAYTPGSGSLHSGVTGREWSGDLDNITQYGLAFYRTTGGPSGPAIFYLRGGGAASSYTDAKITGNSAAVGVCEVGYSAPPVWDEYTVICPDMREGGGLWNGGTASSGTDEFGGADVEDVLQIYAAFGERYDTGDSQRVLWGDSRGGMMAGLAMARGLAPDVCILRSPLLDVADWDSFSDATRSTILADIPGFAGANTDTFAQLSTEDQQKLIARSVNRKTSLLPTTTKYLVVWGEDDDTIPRSQCETFVRLMRARGATVEMQVVREFGHSIGATVGSEVAFLAIKNFLAKHLT